MKTLLTLLLSGTLAAAAEFGAVEYREPSVEARVPWYTVRPDLANVSNRRQLPKLTDQQHKALVAQRFVARPTREEQMFCLYEENQYRDIPSFITTDSVLHTYHVFYDFTLRWLEKDRLLAAVKTLSREMFEANLRASAEALPEAVKNAVDRNLAYFAVPLRLLGETPEVPGRCRDMVEAELRKIAEHQGRAKTIGGAVLDYTQFIPRGHYTREEALRQYFQAMIWYGTVPLELDNDEQTVMALVLTDQFGRMPDARAWWERIYEPTAFFVGRADDLSYADYLPLLRQVYGDGGLSRLGDESKLKAFRKLAEEKLPKPGIETEMVVGVAGTEKVQGRQLRFLGQRYIPDSRILQEVCYPKVGTRDNPREIPKALDIMAVLGSDRAVQILDVLEKQTEYARYTAQRDKLRAEFAALSGADWRQNLYHGWLWSLQPLLAVRPEGWPAFMRSLAWRDKSLITALGSWTELRHDTILYGKQSVAQAGGEEPPPPPGYVEPEPAVYARLGWLIKATRAGLLGRGLLTEDDYAAGSFLSFIDLVERLEWISRKELQNVPLSVEDLVEIKWYGSRLERLMTQAASLMEGVVLGSWWEIKNATDRRMALVADVHTSKARALQEAVGDPAEIWVVVPFKERLVVTRGAMFTWYEFINQADDRLTDEAWQKLLSVGAGAGMPSWAAKVILPPGPTKPQFERGRVGEG